MAGPAIESPAPQCLLARGPSGFTHKPGDAGLTHGLDVDAVHVDVRG